MRRSRRLTRRSALAVLALLLAGGAAPVIAHHGWSGYDASNALTVTGVIREAGDVHSHGHIRLEVPGKTWRVVLGPPTRPERRGLPASMLKIGVAATVVGYPHRTDADEMRAERITIDGKTVELR